MKELIKIFAKWGTIKKRIRNPYWLFYYFIRVTGIGRIMPDKHYLKLQYKCFFNKSLDLKNSKTFNEKLQWLKLYNRITSHVKMVDKAAVKDYIASIIGKEYIIATLGVWNKFDDIRFDLLPNQFVLKCTHDSGSVIICKDKSNFDFKLAKEKINKSLSRNFYYPGREWIYKNIKPRIIAEKYMVDESNVELKDYKIFCFNGSPKIIQVDFNRFSAHRRNLYSIKWELIPAELCYPNDSKTIIEQPKSLELMLDIARKLSSQIAFLRVDLYSIKETIYFGELTFYPGSGYEKFIPDEWDDIMGSWLKLPKTVRML
ncbi:MAG: glycosyl transferase [Prevotellaceae bacterium]|jgi:hypothetical protein|nr:glycosyl transferase [Prevotellaceae bacterium]